MDLNDIEKGIRQSVKNLTVCILVNIVEFKKNQFAMFNFSRENSPVSKLYIVS